MVASLPVAGFTVRRLIRANARSRAYEAVRERDGRRVLAKVVEFEDETDSAVKARIEHEFQLLRGLEVEGVVRALELIHASDQLVLVLEYVDGMDLARMARETRPTTRELVRIGQRLAAILADIHAQRIIHRDVKPSNLLMEAETGALYFADFGISVLVERERQDLFAPTTLEGTLPYISPEQTGRTSHAVDYRSDLYSLGVTLYELATGECPFTSAAPLELVHAHLARRPDSPLERVPKLPEALSDIILRLLEKAPEDRYQSAAGLEADLTQLAEHMDRAAVSGASLQTIRFPLGQRDRATTLQLPRQLFGRERELGRLEVELAGAAASRRPHLLALAGPPGIGKSALVDAFETHHLARGGLAGRGKIEQRRSVEARAAERPYQPWRETFGSLLASLLRLSEAELERWREALIRELGAVAGVVGELVPELEWVLGELPPVPRLPASEAKVRLQLAFARLLATLTRDQPGSAELPVLIILEDLQWSDRASVELLRTLLVALQAPALFLVTLRADELEAESPAADLLEACAPGGELADSFARVDLRPLELDALERLLAATLGRDDAADQPESRLRALTELVARKTDRNPLFIRHFLEHLRDQGLLQPTPEGWTWSLPAIEAAGIPDTVLGVMAAKFAALPERERWWLVRAAQLGARFGPNLLAAATERDAEAMVPALYNLERAGLIGLRGGYYHFAHDRIHEAALAELEPAEARAMRWAIGQQLLASAKRRQARKAEARGKASSSIVGTFESVDHSMGMSASDLGGLYPLLDETRDFAVDEFEFGARLYAIVDHLDAGLDEAVRGRWTDDERLELARLNYAAGVLAQGSAAWASAERYLALAHELLEPELPDAKRGAGPHRAFALSVALNFAKATSLVRRDEADALFEGLLGWTMALDERADVIHDHIVLLNMHGRYDEAVELGIAALAEVGVKVEPKPSALRMILESARGWRSASGASLQKLAALPEAATPKARATLRLVQALKAPSYAASVELFVLLSGLHGRLTLRDGYHHSSALALAQVAVTGAGIGKNEAAGELADRALELARLRPMYAREALQIRTCSLLFVFPACRPATYVLEVFDELQRQSFELGDITNAGVMGAFGLGLMVESGLHLREVLERHRALQTQLDALDGPQMSALYGMYEAYAETLSHDPQAPLEPGESPPRFHEPSNLGAEEYEGLIGYAIAALRAMGMLMLGDLGAARETVAHVADDFDQVLFNSWHRPRLAMVDAILVADSVNEATVDARTRRRAIRRIRKRLKLLRTWAEGSIEQYGPMVQIVEGELASLRNQGDAAVQAFEAAALAAHERRTPNLEGLAYDRLAALAARRHRPASREGALARARAAYHRWGARAVVARIDGELANSALRPSTTTGTGTRSRRTRDTRSRRGAGHRASATQSWGKSDAPIDGLDLETVLSTMQLIAEDLLLDEVAARVLRAAIENAGGDRGTLLIEREGQVRAVATATAEDAAALRPPMLLDELGELLPLSLVYLTLRTGEAIVVDDARTDSRLASDAYVVAKQPRSLLCAPIVKHGERVGAIVLENHLNAGSFTAQRMTVLRFLLGQAASALDNADLYEALQRSEAQWRSLVGDAPDSIVLLDPDGAIAFANHFDARAADPERLIGTPGDQGMLPEDAARWREALAQVLATGTTRALEVELRDREGQPRWFSVRLAPITRASAPSSPNSDSASREVTKVVGILTDITQRHLAALDKARLERRLQQQQRLESIGSLAAGVAHEINNPIHGISSYAELIADTPDASDEVRELAGEIRREAGRVSTIARDLLRFSRRGPEGEGHDQPGHQLERVPLPRIFDETSTLLRTLLSQDHVKVERRLESDLPALRCRPQQIQQVIVNLVTNARDALNSRYPGAHPDKRIWLRASTLPTVSNGRAFVRISVEDRGGGIPEHLRTQIFDPFFTTKPRDRGTGLGLSVSHKLATEHGGELSLEVEDGVGTTFHLDLPIDGPPE
ncbi:Predicted ATPase [Plesiocystis pacifica SIR-1]|uniref:histidine kinase n=1 Tax=Plesiocystis pacifica SIR-1 TaxID=391625 RepID=A6G8Q6_9BACT|nr:AAA family ATPase [Plesiocystis pacifica]EDM77716.1 Predicted ATPase [Plesiocystis pacifica SIR-1]